MGWTSFDYKEATHLTFNSEKARSFMVSEFNRDGYHIEHMSFLKAKDKYSKHEVYALVRHPTGYLFILVVIIEIDNNEIYYKEMDQSQGPIQDRCPIQYIDKVKDRVTNKFALAWFENCRKNNIQIVLPDGIDHA